MSFASPTFLWYFLPTVLALYLILPKRWRNALISVSSLVFYIWGAGQFVFLLLACMAVNYSVGILIDSPRVKKTPGRRRSLLISAIVVDLLILCVWKYGGFLSVQVHNLSQSLNLGDTTIVALALPIGISFFTFHHMSYVIDVYRGSRSAQKSPIQFITYIAMFPQLIAGPIVRYNEISEQLADTNRNRWSDISRGFPRFALGLSKKVIVADSVSPIADAAFATSAGDLTTGVAWLGALAYTVQIYFDFSAYTDMAIGLGQMLGFRLPENFDRPYSADSITDFWRRWHMSLSRWFRDYVYIPLGGNRAGKFNTYRNLAIIFFLTGLWHGAAWTFIIWGVYHGALMVIERLTGVGTRQSNSLAESVIRRLFTFFLVVVGWVFFRAQGLHEALTFLHAMFWPTAGPIPDTITAAWSTQGAVFLAFGVLVVFMPRNVVMGRVIEDFTSKWSRVFRIVVICLFTPYAAIAVAAGTFSPFLYFQF